MGILMALLAGYGAFLLATAIGSGWRGLGMTPRRPTSVRGAWWRRRLDPWIEKVAQDRGQLRSLAGASSLLLVTGGAVAYVVFDGILPSIAAGVFASTFPWAAQRARMDRKRAQARDAWPRMIEEIRLQTTSLGRSIPQAVFEVGRRSPEELRPAFEAAEREWVMSTDLARTFDVLKARLADATADTICETLLVAHEVGGSDVDRRLAALAEDRIQDLRGRKDARAKQEGVRFARRFVLLVPAGMGLAGLSIGAGRAAYATGVGQIAVAFGVVVVAGCWLWAGRLLKLPDEERVLR